MESWEKWLKHYEQIWKPFEKEKSYQLVHDLWSNILRPEKNNLQSNWRLDTKWLTSGGKI